ncbi:hydrogenase [Candidatus Poribacteria bacterium]|nr:hydrogenase [Candidatus Poribacteria bacterium]
MSELLNPILVLLLALNFFALGTSRMQALINVVALQGVLLGLSPLLVHEQIRPTMILIALGAAGIKGVLVPRLLEKAMRTVNIRRDVEPVVGYVPTLVLGAAGMGLAMAFAEHLPLAAGHTNQLLIPASFSTIISGFLLLTCRQKAITQVVGYLVMDNGIFIFGIVLVEAVPFLVEVGLLLDLLVLVFIMGIIVNHIQRTFASISTHHLTSLREE